MISNIFSQTIFFSLRFLTFAFSAKKFKAKKKETFERKKRKENYQFVSLKNISIDRGTNRGQKKFLCNRSDSYDTCAVNARRSTGSISLYRCGVYIGLFAMLVDVSCVRGVKWAAWHLQLQPLGLNKGRSLAAFPTQLSPFYHGFHSCFISSVSLHRVHTMRRHLGRVHSSVFSIFFPSCFWLLLFSSLLFFFFLLFRSPPADQSQSDGNPRFVGCNPFANCTRFFVEFLWSRRCCSNVVALADWLSFPVPLLLFFTFISLSVFGLGFFRSVWSINGTEFTESLRTVESENLSLLRFALRSRDLL